jgi:hypothetical protein
VDWPLNRGALAVEGTEIEEMTWFSSFSRDIIVNKPDWIAGRGYFLTIGWQEIRAATKGRAWGSPA